MYIVSLPPYSPPSLFPFNHSIHHDDLECYHHDYHYDRIEDRVPYNETERMLEWSRQISLFQMESARAQNDARKAISHSKATTDALSSFLICFTRK